MILKIFCGIIAVSGFAYCGFFYAQTLKTRLLQLDGFCDGLSLLEFNIRYMNFPLSEAFFKTADTIGGVVGKVFSCFAKRLSEDCSPCPNEAFSLAIEENLGLLKISEEEIEILKSFSKTLGEGDREAEINNIKTAEIRLAAAKEDAEEEILKRVKLSRRAGVLIGLLVVIVLF